MPQTAAPRPDADRTAPAHRPNHVWAIDFCFDETADQRRLKMANVVDEFTRECLAIRVGRSCDADQLIDVLEMLVAERGAPDHLRTDNGPEMIAWALRDWCRLSGTTTTYIEPGAPWENPFVESFNGRFRDECLNVEEFGDLPLGSLSRTGESSTTRSGPTRLSVDSPPPSSSKAGPTNSANSCNSWTRYRGPLTSATSFFDCLPRSVKAHCATVAVEFAQKSRRRHSSTLWPHSQRSDGSTEWWMVHAVS